MQDALHTRKAQQVSRKSDYEQLSFERYPDSANLLPIPVEAYIFVHNGPNSELP